MRWVRLQPVGLTAAQYGGYRAAGMLIAESQPVSAAWPSLHCVSCSLSCDCLDSAGLGASAFCLPGPPHPRLGGLPSWASTSPVHTQVHIHISPDPAFCLPGLPRPQSTPRTAHRRFVTLRALRVLEPVSGGPYRPGPAPEGPPSLPPSLSPPARPPSAGYPPSAQHCHDLQSSRAVPRRRAQVNKSQPTRRPRSTLDTIIVNKH